MGARHAPFYQVRPGSESPLLHANPRTQGMCLCVFGARTSTRVLGGRRHDVMAQPLPTRGPHMCLGSVKVGPNQGCVVHSTRHIRIIGGHYQCRIGGCTRCFTPSIFQRRQFIVINPRFPKLKMKPNQKPMLRTWRHAEYIGCGAHMPQQFKSSSHIAHTLLIRCLLSALSDLCRPVLADGQLRQVRRLVNHQPLLVGEVEQGDEAERC